jgi:conjugative relaxase-like TrwC/TraI family protein
VLSIGKIALGQHRYYERQVAQGRDDYYTGRGEAPGEWTGAGAQALGLSGRVGSGQFNALISGRDPSDPSTRLRSSEQDPKVAAFDLTFSAPKTVSILFAVAPLEVSGVLAACHEEAVRAALGYLEDTAVAVRRGHAGEHVQPGEGLIAAAYRHRMSRALDPQLHTHVVAANMARGPDGRFTALHAAELYRAAKTAGCLYQAHLRALVTERTGLEWGPVHNGAAELAAVDRPVVEHFSQRRHEMIREAEKGGIGLGSKSAAEHAALATRERKQYGVETHTWREEVRARAGEQGLDTEKVAGVVREGYERLGAGLAERPGVDERALGDRLAGAEGLTERANTFDDRPVLQEFAAAATAGALVGEVRSQAGRFTERVDVIATLGREMTTAELVAVERRLIAAAAGRAGEGTAVVDGSRVERAIAAAERPLTAEQAEAVRAVIGSGDGVSVIEALAGTGKTYTAGVLRQVYERAGYEVLGTAPTGRAVRELAEEAGVSARTVDRLLLDAGQPGGMLPRGCVMILDEAGMAATRPSARLLEAAERAGAKVVAIGDPGQLASVQAGGWLRAVGERLGAHRLTEVMRQRDPQERKALGALHDGRPDRWLDWAGKAGRIGTFADPAGACGQALAEWAQKAGENGLARTVMIARDNDTRDRLNRGARDLRREAGALGETFTYGPVEVAVGDRVICRRNDGRFDVDNGMRGTVRHLDAEGVVVDTDGGLVRELPASYVAEHVEHAYALTGHGMQGGTVEASVVVASPRDLTAGWSYTALSRARGETRLLVHDEQFSRERGQLAPEEDSPASRDDLLARTGRRMVERDDEDLAVEQLPGAEHGSAAGRADDCGLAVGRTRAAGPPQEQAAARAEPATPAAPSAERLRALEERRDQLRTQLKALPTRQLQCIEDLDARILTLTGQHAQLAERLAALRESTRCRGRWQDPDAADRAFLTGAVQDNERGRAAVLEERTRLEHEIGDPAEARAERDGIEHAIGQATREHRALSKELDKLDRDAPGERDRANSRERDERGIDLGIGF